MFSLLKRKATTFNQLTWREMLWFLLLYLLSGVIRAALLLLPFKIFSKVLGDFRQNIQLNVLASPAEEAEARRVARLVDMAARYTPWESKCLVRAVMVRLFLGFYGISYVIYLGVKKSDNDTQDMMAHAWVCVGGRVVIGGRGHSAFTVVGTYTSSALRHGAWSDK